VGVICVSLIYQGAKLPYTHVLVEMFPFGPVGQRHMRTASLLQILTEKGQGNLCATFMSGPHEICTEWTGFCKPLRQAYRSSAVNAEFSI
jgi:hypothetical protein